MKTFREEGLKQELGTMNQAPSQPPFHFVTLGHQLPCFLNLPSSNPKLALMEGTFPLLSQCLTETVLPRKPSMPRINYPGFSIIHVVWPCQVSFITHNLCHNSLSFPGILHMPMGMTSPIQKCAEMMIAQWLLLLESLRPWDLCLWSLWPAFEISLSMSVSVTTEVVTGN